MESLILALHIVVCILLVILILLQSGKEGMGVIFGGGNTSVFGSSGAGGMLAKMTAFVAIVFIGTSLSYTYVTGTHETKESEIVNIRIEEPAPAPMTAPSAPVVPEAAAPTAPAAEPTLAPAVEPAVAEPAAASAQTEIAAPVETAPAADETPAPAAPAETAPVEAPAVEAPGAN